MFQPIMPGRLSPCQFFPFQFERPAPFGLLLPARLPEPIPALAGFVLGQFAVAVTVRNVRHKEVMAVLRNHVLPALGHKRLDRVSRQEVEAWLSGLRGRYRASTVARYFAILKSVFNLAVREGLLGRSPCLGLEKPRCPKTRFPVLTQAEPAYLIGDLKDANNIRAMLGQPWGPWRGPALFGVGLASRSQNQPDTPVPHLNRSPGLVHH